VYQVGCVYYVTGYNLQNYKLYQHRNKILVLAHNLSHLYPVHIVQFLQILSNIIFSRKNIPTLSGQQHIFKGVFSPLNALCCTPLGIYRTSHSVAAVLYNLPSTEPKHFKTVCKGKEVDGVFLQQPTEKAKASLTKFGIAMDHKLLLDLQLLGSNCVVGQGWEGRS
jgi:hypothetical protein